MCCLLMSKLLVFDINDTLLDSRNAYNEILIGLISDNYGISSTLSGSIYRKSEKEALKKQKYMSEKKFFLEFHKIVLGNLGVELTMENLDNFSKLVSQMDDLFSNHVKLYPGVKGALRELRKKGWKIAALTGSRRGVDLAISKKQSIKKMRRVKDSLAFTGIDNLIDKVFYAYSKGLLKPSKEAFMLPINYFDVDIKNTVFIGDTYEDIMAKDYGFETIHFDRGSNKKLSGDSFSHYKDLIRLLD